VGWAWLRGVVGVAWAVPVSLGSNLGFDLMLGILSSVIHTLL
jgi:hypothetical protein